MNIRYNYNRKVFMIVVVCAILWVICQDYSLLGVIFFGVILVLYGLHALIGGWVTAIESQSANDLLIIDTFSIKGRRKLNIRIEDGVKAKFVKVTGARGGKRLNFILFSDEDVIYSLIIDQVGFTKKDFVEICADLGVAVEE